MKNKEEVAKDIKEILLSLPTNMEEYYFDDISKSITEYINTEFLTIKRWTRNIDKEMEPFLSEQVKSWWNNRMFHGEEIRIDNDIDGELHCCYMGVTIQRSIKDVEEGTSLQVLTKEYEMFAHLINKAAEKGLIHTGALATCFEMELAVVSPVKRTMLLFYPGTFKTIKELTTIHQVFLNEGELAMNINDVDVWE